MGGVAARVHHGGMNEDTATHEAAAPASPPPAPPGPRQALRRSTTDRKIAGVAGGLGRYFDIDPLIFRIVLVTLAVFGGSGLLLYAIGWLLVPEDGDEESEAARLVNGRATPRIVGGILLGVVGLVVVGNFARTGFGFGGFAALVAVVVAAYLISRGDHARPVVPPRSPTPAPPPAAASGAFGQTPGTAYATPAGPAGPVAPPPYAGLAQPPAPPRPRSVLGRATVSIALLTAGLLVVWNLVTSHDVPAEILLACCLAVVGLGLVVGAVRGRARGLILLGAVLTVATTAAAVTHSGIGAGIGNRSWAPHSVAGVHHTYRLGAGTADLDLSRVDLSGGERLDIDVRQGIGDLRITLPPDVSADVLARVRVGEIRMPSGANPDGTSVRRHYVDPRGETDPTITIDAELGLGSLEVLRATP